MKAQFIIVALAVVLAAALAAQATSVVQHPSNGVYYGYSSYPSHYNNGYYNNGYYRNLAYNNYQYQPSVAYAPNGYSYATPYSTAYYYQGAVPSSNVYSSYYPSHGYASSPYVYVK